MFALIKRRLQCTGLLIHRSQVLCELAEPICQLGSIFFELVGSRPLLLVELGFSPAGVLVRYFFCLTVGREQVLLRDLGSVDYMCLVKVQPSCVFVYIKLMFVGCVYEWSNTPK